MLSYEKTQEICKVFYEDSLKFYKSTNNPISEELAMGEVLRLQTNPFSPNGDDINQIAKVDFVKNIIEEKIK